MRIAGVFWATILLVAWAGAEEAIPYSATVAHEAVLVRSGPGESFYPTSRLLKGDAVEVHREGPNGWCAIRPPDGEFSLIASVAVMLLPGDDLLEVNEREAAVWVGSNVARPDPHRWQIHLQRGERAAVLGVRAGAGDDGKPVTWYKIAPPAGEFRWIPREALTAENETAILSAEQEMPAANEAPHQHTAEDDEEAKSLAKAPTLAEPLTEEISVLLPMTAGANRAPDETAPVVQASLESAVKAELPLTPMLGDSTREIATEPMAAAIPAFTEADLRIEPSPRTPREEALNASPERVLSDEAFEAEATALQIGLTLAVAQDLSRWRLGPLRDRAERLRANAPSAELQERAVSLIATIARFEGLYEQYRRYAYGRSARAPRQTSSGVHAMGLFASAGNERFDVAGRLAPLADGFEGPPFAILNAEGQIQAYVTPAAGVDLSNYAGRTVGVSGLTSRDERLQSLHVVAKTVKPLSR